VAKTQALTRWNDAPDRTSDEVLAVLDRAIAPIIQTLAALPPPRLSRRALRPGRRPASAAAPPDKRVI